MHSPRLASALLPLLLAALACGYGGPVQDEGTPGNHADGSGTWRDVEDDSGEGDTESGLAPASLAVAPDEHYAYALFNSQVVAVELATGIATPVASSGNVVAWGVFFGSTESLVVAVERHDVGLVSVVWRLQGADLLGSATFDLDLRDGRVSPTGLYLCVSDDFGFDVIGMADLSIRRVETDSEMALSSQVWIPESDQLLRVLMPTNEHSTLPGLSIQAWDVALETSGARVTVSNDVDPVWWRWSPPSIHPDGSTAAVPFGTSDGIPETALIDLVSGVLVTTLPGLGDPVEYLPSGTGLLAWQSDDQSLVLVPEEGEPIHFPMGTSDVPAWTALEDADVVVASTAQEAGVVDLHILDIASGSQMIVDHAVELHEIAVRGTAVFLIAEESEADPPGLYRLDTSDGEFTWTGLDASVVTYLPGYDALLVDDPGDSGLYRLVDAGTLQILDWYQLAL